MVLRVTNDNIDGTLGTAVMSIEEFCVIRNHPFIASSHFDSVVVDLDERIPAGYLKHLVGTTKLIPKLIGPVTTHTIRMLSEIYPEYAPRLRHTFLLNRAGVSGLISEIAGTYRWDKFY